jgi:hypothetical protein
VKRSDLVRRVRTAAREASLDWELLRTGREHDVWICGRTKIAIPRHREINPYTAEAIFKDLEAELGEDWWRAPGR